MTGTLARGNGDDGVQIRSRNNTSAAPCRPPERVSGNVNRGLAFFTSAGTADANMVRNNYIGVDSTGTGRWEMRYGVSAYNVSNSKFLDNVISANGSYGVWFRTSTATGNTVQGNLDRHGRRRHARSGERGRRRPARIAGEQQHDRRHGPGQGNTIAYNARAGVNVAAKPGSRSAATRSTPTPAWASTSATTARRPATGTRSGGQPNAGMDAPVFTRPRCPPAR